MWEKVWTIPNVITTGRAIVGVVSLMLMLYPSMIIVGWIVFAICFIILDKVDGVVARSLGQCSPLGEFLDPLADKVLFYGVMFIHLHQYVWIPILILMCVLDILSTVLHVTKPCGAVLYGKWKAGLQYASAVLFVVGGDIISNNVVTTIGNICLCVAIMLAFNSLKQRIEAK